MAMDVTADEQTKRARSRAACGKRLPKNIEKSSESGLDGFMTILDFGPFRLDGESEILFRGNEPVPLGRRAVALLRVLVERSGTPVSKDALVGAAWAGLAVDDSNLTVQIAALRRVLGAEAGGESWIETLPRRGYRFLGPQVTTQATGTGSQVAAALAPPKNRPSIVVMLFTNMSGDPDQEYFADGMVEEVITGLARIKWLSVVSRSTSLVYKNKPADVKDVAEKLGVRYLLEGSVRRSGSRVRITAQLIDAEAGTQLWADKYDRMLENVFELQDEITMCVVGAIEPSLRRAEIDRVKRQRPSIFSAYDLLLRSQQFVFAGMPAEAEKTIPLLEQALNLDPDYSAAHAYLGWCYHAIFGRGGMREEDRLAAIRHARAAVALGSDDATALAISALVLAYDDTILRPRSRSSTAR
jgi:TolB-like protein